MNEISHLALCLAWVLSLLGLVGGIWAACKGSSLWLVIARLSTIAQGALAVLAVLGLGFLFLNNDYSNQYVWQYSNRDMEVVYKFAAIWGGMDGSMLLWCAFLGIVSIVVAATIYNSPKALAPWVLAVLNSSAIFFLSITVFVTNPFRYLQSTMLPLDGNGLNPLLQNPYMAFHPPFLYLGFTAFAVPFAYALAALLSGEFGQAWLRHSRTWTVAAWSFLTVGIVLGAFWAYIELGWGGFWAWDPVENASFLPWLMGTAFLHTSVLQQRRRILEFWNIILCLGTYLLTVLGTFLTRSGIVQSVHAFASSDSSAVFLSYMVFVLLLSVGLIALRWSKLRSGRRIENLLSKETLLLLNSLILVSVCFAVLWGVFFPVLSEALLGKKQAVAAPFFNAVNVPFFLLLLFVLALGMLVPWGGISLKALGARMLMPLSLGLLCSISLLGLGVENFYALLCYGLCACAGSAVGLEIFGRTTLQKGGKVNFGAQLVHLGLLIVAVSVCASTVHKSEVDFSLNQGQEFSYEGFSFKLEDLKPYAAKNYEAHTAQVEVRQGQDGSPYTLVPELRVYPRSKETTSEIALRVALWEDLYLVLADINYQEKQAVFRLFINPLQVWLWIGAAIMAFGGIIVLISRLRSRNTEGANE